MLCRVLNGLSEWPNRGSEQHGMPMRWSSDAATCAGLWSCTLATGA